MAGGSPCIIMPHLLKICHIPLVLSPVCAGFPSPATDYIDKKN